MKTIILAGGMGSRLGSITETIPKPMVMIGGKPIIWHIMKIYADYGHKDFIISLGYKAEVIKEYFHNYRILNNDFSVQLGSQETEILNEYNKINWKVSLIDTGLHSLKGARIKRLEQYLDDVNMFTYGDGVADVDINKVLEYHKSHGKMVTITGVKPPSRFGEIVENDGKLVSFEEKPQTSTGLINGGFAVFHKDFLQHLREDEDCDLEYGPLGDLAQKGEVMVYRHEGQWACVDTERDLNHLNKMWENQKAFW